MYRIFITGSVLIDNFVPDLSCKDGDYSGNCIRSAEFLNGCFFLTTFLLIKINNNGIKIYDG